MPKIFKTLILLSCLLFGVSGCAYNADSEKPEYSDTNVLEFTIIGPGREYNFFYTDDNKVVVIGADEQILCVADVEERKDLIDFCLENIKGYSQAGELDFVVNDFWDVELRLYNQKYHFVYGASQNPYINILVELIVGGCDCKEVQDVLVPYPSTFR